LATERQRGKGAKAQRENSHRFHRFHGILPSCGVVRIITPNKLAFFGFLIFLLQSLKEFEIMKKKYNLLLEE
jgi:hypothetical protein